MDNNLNNELKSFVSWITDKRKEALEIIQLCEKKYRNTKLKPIYTINIMELVPSNQQFLDKYKTWHNYLDEECTDKLRKAFLNIEFDDNCLSLLDEKIREYIISNIDELNTIEPYQLQLFLNTIDEINYFRGGRLRNGTILNDDDNRKYKTEMDGLKKEADNLQYYSKEQIKIRLPRLPKDSLLILFHTLREENISKKAEDFFFNYFIHYEDRKNKPRGKDDFLLSLKARFRLSINDEIGDYLTHSPSLKLSYFAKNTPD